MQSFKKFVLNEESSYITKKISHSTIVYKEHPSHIEISSVRTPAIHRGKGEASKAIKHVLDYADSIKKPVRLIASPLDKKTKTHKLVNLYQKHGFELTGEKANYAGDPWMERK
jgi:ribosomal protein S18 acetylase RimI-like enzyme